MKDDREKLCHKTQNKTLNFIENMTEIWYSINIILSLVNVCIDRQTNKDI